MADEEDEKILITNPRTGMTEEHPRTPGMWDRVKEGTMMNSELHKRLTNERAMLDRMRKKMGK